MVDGYLILKCLDDSLEMTNSIAIGYSR
jgi:hypothetical protein